MIEKNAGLTAGQSQVYTDLSSLQKITVQGHTDKGAAMKSIAHQFESMMVQQMMKSMRQANETFSEGDMTSSSEEKFYQDMSDNQLALTLSQGRGFGIAEALMRQFHGKLADAVADRKGVAAGDNEQSHALQNVVRQPAGLSAATDADSSAAFTEAVYRLFQQSDKAESDDAAAKAVDASALDGTPENFVKTLRPIAEQIGRQLGVDSRVLLSQAALETGWGQKVLQRSGGTSSFNFFNIKAGADWQGPTVTVPTIEYQNGVAVREMSTFRAYQSAEQGFGDYARLIADNPRYQQALQHGGNSSAYIKALASAGYATDPRYAEKVLALLNSDKLNIAPLDRNGLSDAQITNEQFSGDDWPNNYSEFDQL